MSIEAKCPKCGGVMVARKGKHGDFFGCSEYPKCTHTTKARPGFKTQYKTAFRDKQVVGGSFEDGKKK